MDRRHFMKLGAALPIAVSADEPDDVRGRHRARDLGIRIGLLQPGTGNAITDVAGVEVGHTTLIHGDGPLRIGEGPVRTGVTAIWPHRGIVEQYLPCGMDAPNGNGEVTGILQARQLGVISSPICLTNTSSVGMVYQALTALQPVDELPPGVPVVCETWDGSLNDIIGRHVHEEHVRHALDSARGGPVQEGAVGGGTGMICYDFKGGIGTASRVVSHGDKDYVVGALVQANHGDRSLLRIDGVPVGEEICAGCETESPGEQNSIIMVLATDAPLLPHQLRRLARRATHGLARTGSISGNSSGDFAIAFSTANRIPRREFHRGQGYAMDSVDQFAINPLLQAAAEAVEESIINALFMAEDMTGKNGYHVPAIPLAETLSSMRRHGRLAER